MSKHKKKNLIIPAFKSEDDERDFWSSTDLSKYLDKGDAVSVSFPDLKPSSSSISIRIPSYLLARVKERANAIDIPYQSLIKSYIAHGVAGK